MGVSRNPANLAAAIRFVQRAEGSFECFGTAKGHCDQTGCTWRRECLASPARGADPELDALERAGSVLTSLCESVAGRVQHLEKLRT
jgi:hypothetical protein